MLLESLPEVALESIFRELHTPDLINLTVLSKGFSSLSYKRLYERLIICDDRSDYPLETISEARPFQFTIMVKSSVTILLKGIRKNKSLAGLIHAIHINVRHVCTDINELLTLIKVHELYTKHWHFLPPKATIYLHTIFCPLPQAFGLTSTVVDLRVTYSGTRHHRDCFKSLAREFINSGGYKNLKSLSFVEDECGVCESFEDEDEINLSEESEDVDYCPQIPYWNSFFEVLAENGVLLHLESMNFVKDLPIEAARSISSAVKLSALTSFAIYNDIGEYELDPVIKYMLSQCTSLRHFVYEGFLHPCFLEECLSESIPKGQLETLQVWFSDHSLEEATTVLNFILSHQRCLKTLVIKESLSPRMMQSTNELQKIFLF